MKYSDNFRPLADAGTDQLAETTVFPILVALDGSASSDPNGSILTYHWNQISGTPVSLSDANAVQPTFDAFEVGTYIFELIVNNGSFSSFPDTVTIVVKNDPSHSQRGR